jgi:glutathione synthase/RimK-type ligase-like ATP-grasp enzyme
MNTCGRAEQSKILVFATENNPLCARVSMALADVGFHVAALTRRGHPVREGRKISHHFSYRSLFRLKSIVRAIDRWAPDLVVCTDDLAVRELQDLHRRIAISDDRAERRVSDLIELSLGPPASFPAMRNKSSFLALARLEGLPVPRTIVIPANRAFESMPAELTYPVVVKADHSDGGRCVRIVDGEADLRSIVWELQTPNTWRGRRLFGAILASEALSQFKLPLRRTISLQEYKAGRPANRAVICWKGRVVAGITVEVVEVTHERGPASIVRPVDHPEIATICERMVQRLRLCGFVGFDFIIDSANRAWLLEMNPRVTQICHFSLSDGTDLAGALYTVMKGQPPHPRHASINRDLVALFPNEIVRSSSSSYLLSCQHDVPWEEPEIVRCVLNRMRRKQVRRQARNVIEYYLPAVVRGLVRIGLLDGHAASDSPAYLKGIAAPWEGIAPPL